MKKDEFLIKLRANLIDHGVSEETADKETEAVRVYLSESNMDEVDISVEVMADGIISVLDDSTEKEMTIPVAVSDEPETESVSDEFSAAIAHINGESTPGETDENAAEAEETAEASATAIPVFIDPEADGGNGDESENIDPEFLLALENDLISAEPTEEPITEVANAFREAPLEVPEEPQENGTEISEEPGEPCEVAETAEETPEPIDEVPEPIGKTSDDPIEELEAVFSDEIPPQPQPHNEPVAPAPVPVEDEEEAEIEEFIPLDKKRRMKNTPSKSQSKTSGNAGNKTAARGGTNDWLYIALLVVTIPIAIALVLVAFVLYLGFWVLLALAMIGCIAALIVFVTLGSIVALVGIVYGVVQLITGMTPVGLFEIGLGIVVGAVVMCIGILVYNFAVRFIPFGMKLLAKLFRTGFRALRSGYQSLKGAIDSL